MLRFRMIDVTFDGDAAETSQLLRECLTALSDEPARRVGQPAGDPPTPALPSPPQAEPEPEPVGLDDSTHPTPDASPSSRAAKQPARRYRTVAPEEALPVDPLDDADAFKRHLSALPPGRRLVVERTKCRTARELVRFGRTQITAIEGCGSKTCDHLDDWLGTHFGKSLDR